MASVCTGRGSGRGTRAGRRPRATRARVFWRSRSAATRAWRRARRNARTWAGDHCTSSIRCSASAQVHEQQPGARLAVREQAVSVDADLPAVALDALLGEEVVQLGAEVEGLDLLHEADVRLRPSSAVDAADDAELPAIDNEGDIDRHLGQVGGILAAALALDDAVQLAPTPRRPGPSARRRAAAPVGRRPRTEQRTVLASRSIRTAIGGFYPCPPTHPASGLRPQSL